jgi:lipopolysaccharide export system protein LptA
LRIAVSLAIVMVSYWTYRFAVVPWIEPSAGKPKLEMGDNGRSEPVDRLAAYRDYFEPDAWELKESTKLFESDQVKLLWESLTNEGDGKMRLSPCTMIFTPNGSLGEESPSQETFVLQAPKGAILRFDHPFDLQRGSYGRLTSGYLPGEVTIRSLGKSAGSDDDLHLVTSDVQLNEESIRAPGAVAFRYGLNSGSGNEMEIRFIPGDKAAANTKTGMNVAGIESLRLRQLDILRLMLPGRNNESPKDNSPSVFRTANAGAIPIEVTCRGRFFFDLAAKTAVFERQVDVRKINPNGPVDQLNCEALEIHFEKAPPKVAGNGAKPEAGETGKRSGSAGALNGLQAKRLDAKGNPVTVFAPSEGLEARGEVLSYDLAKSKITISDASEAFLKQGQNEVHGRWLEYRASPEAGRLGEATASGPGWLRAEIKDRPGSMFEARWNNELSLNRNKEGKPFVWIKGGASLQYGPFGRLSASEIVFWMIETATNPSQPPPAQTPSQRSSLPRIMPDSLLATDQVHLDSDRLTGDVSRLEVWFVNSAPATAGLPALDDALEAAPLRRALATAPGPVPFGTQKPVDAAQQLAWNAAETVAGSGPPASPAAFLAASPAGNPAASPASAAGMPASAPLGKLPGADQYNVEGQLLRISVAMLGQQAEPTDIIVEKGVRVTQRQGAKPNEKPLLITGEQLQIVNAMKPYAAVTIAGAPAHVEARGMTLTGSSINLNRGTNALWMERPGMCELIADRDFIQGRSLTQPVPLTIQWSEKMRLEGQKVTFEGNVTAASGHQSLNTDSMAVQFKEPIRFAEPSAGGKNEIHKVSCRGKVLIRSATFAGPEQTAFEQMETVDLDIDAISGDVQAGGPGKITSIRRGAPPTMLGGNLAGGTPDGRDAAGGARLVSGREPLPDGQRDARRDSAPLNYLCVEFQRKLDGNHRRGIMTFHELVRTVYGPVDSWTSVLPKNRPELLGPQGGVMECDRLSIVQKPGPVQNKAAIELEAAGNARAEGQQYTARASRITYDQSKSMMVLEGDGWSDASLYRQKRVGEQPEDFHAHRFYFWPETKQLSIDKATSLDMTLSPTGVAPARERQ